MPWIIPEVQRVFLHVPKTGGNWVIKTVRDLGMKIEEAYGSEKYKDAEHVCPSYPRFTVLRNPLTWYPSYWANCNIFGCRGLGFLSISEDCQRNLHDFTLFMQSVLDNHPGFLTGLFSEYAASDVDVLFTESLAEDLFRILNPIVKDKASLEEIEPVNRCASLPEYKLRVYYSSDMHQRILESESELFDKYGFDRSNPLLYREGYSE